MSTNVILTWRPSDQIFSKQGVVMPLAAQFTRPAARAGEAAAESVVMAATAMSIASAANVVVAIRLRIELNLDSFIDSWAYGVTVAGMSDPFAAASRGSLAWIGDGRKPLTTSQTPSENSNRAIGRAVIAA